MTTEANLNPNLNPNPTGTGEPAPQVDPLLGGPSPSPAVDALPAGPTPAITDSGKPLVDPLLAGPGDDDNGEGEITPPTRRTVWPWFLAAAIVMAIMGITADHFFGGEPAKKPAVVTAPQPANGGTRKLDPMPPASPNGGNGGATARAPQPVPPPADLTPAPASPAGPSRTIVAGSQPVRTLGCEIASFTEAGLVTKCDWFKASGEMTPSLVNGFVNLHLEVKDENGRILRSSPKPVKMFQTGDLGPVAFYATK